MPMPMPISIPMPTPVPIPILRGTHVSHKTAPQSSSRFQKPACPRPKTTIGLHHRQRCQSSSQPPPPASTDLRAGIHGSRHASWCLTPADTSFASHPIACLTQVLLGSWHMGSNKQPSIPEHSAPPATSHTLHIKVPTRLPKYRSYTRFSSSSHVPALACKVWW